MKLLAVIAITISLISTSAFAMSDKEEQEFLNKLTYNIQHRNFVCNKAEKAAFIGETEQGGIFHVYCDKYRFSYKVLIRPDGTSVITPWR